MLLYSVCFRQTNIVSERFKASGMPLLIDRSDAVVRGAEDGESNTSTFLFSRDPREGFSSSLVILAVSQGIGDMHREKRICAVIDRMIKMI